MSGISWTQAGRIADGNEGGDSPAQAEVMRLFGELRLPLLRYLYTLGLPASDGEDVVQEAFLALHRHLLEDKPRDNLNGWIFRVSRNLALKRMRQAMAHPVVEEPPSLADPAASPEQQAWEQQQERSVRAVVAALPELDRQCLYLRAEGLRYREIAEALDISLGQVALVLSRALEKLARVAQK